MKKKMASQNWCFIGKVLQRKLELEKVVFLVTFHRPLSEKCANKETMHLCNMMVFVPAQFNKQSYSAAKQGKRLRNI